MVTMLCAVDPTDIFAVASQVKYSQEPGNPTKCKISALLRFCNASGLVLEALSSSCGGSDGLFVLSVQRLRPWAGISGSTSRFVSLRIDCFLIILLWS